MYVMRTSKELEDELYFKFKALGVNVGELKRANLPLSQLEDFYRRLVILMKNHHAGWFGEAN